jgi:diguanylate cyclase (GGDEF)-like protein
VSPRDKQSTLFIQAADRGAAAPDDGTAVIVMLYPPGPDLGRRFPLTPDREHVVGRLDELDIPIDAESVSRRHARLFRTSQGWLIDDLGSTNGTWVNDQRIGGPLILRDGDQLRFGGAIAKFLSGKNIETAYHEEIYRMSIVDGLTGVHNKRYFLEFLEREIAGAARYTMPLSLVLFDIDHFKQVNDTHGHLAGDVVLKELARRLKPRIRREDLLARYGGEEFACLLTKTPTQGAMMFAESVRDIVARQPFPWENLLLPITVSLGVATFEGARPVPGEELISQADRSLYEAKRTGRNRVVGPDP